MNEYIFVYHIDRIGTMVRGPRGTEEDIACQLAEEFPEAIYFFASVATLSNSGAPSQQK